MSSERKIDPFAALVLVFSIIAIILMATQYFASFFLTGYSARHSCLDCDYATAGDLAAQIITIILLVIQIVIALNDLVPNRFIQKDLETAGLLMAILTIILVVGGYLSFMITYFEYDSWPEGGFYAGIIAGIVNTIMFFLKYKNK